MENIIKPNSFVSNLLTLPKPDKVNTYKLSKFCRLLDVDGHKLCFNNITKELIELSENEINIVLQLPKKYDISFDQLIEHGVLVPTTFDENKYSDSIYNMYRMFLDKRDYIDNFTIVTTSACNARCYYCFEEGAKVVSMSDETINRACEFIKEKSKGHQVAFSWFGGEPLCNLKAIDRISTFCENNGIKYSSRITTNGYLFDAEIVERAKKSWNLRSVQITLDGTEDVYNSIKNYREKNVTSPFKRVIHNIQLLLEADIKVIIRLNVSQENYIDLFELINYLDRTFTSNREKLYIYSASLFDFTLDIAVRQSRVDMVENLRSHITELGFNSFNKKFMSRLTSLQRDCMALDKSSVVIGPEGRLSRCEHYFIDEHTYGSIYDDTFDEVEYSYWINQSRISECKDCFNYVKCSGLRQCPLHFQMCDNFERKYLLDSLDRVIASSYRLIKSKKESI